MLGSLRSLLAALTFIGAALLATFLLMPMVDAGDSADPGSAASLAHPDRPANPERPGRQSTPTILAVQPTVFVINEAGGPPAQSCSAALAGYPKRNGSGSRGNGGNGDNGQSNNGTRSRTEVAGMSQILVTPNRPDLSLLPGGRPEALPLQPLEGSPEALARVGEVLRKAAGGGRTRLSFFGASHTEADFWTGRIRRVLQQRYGDGGHGFVMPAAFVSGYRASDIGLCFSPGWRGDWAQRRSGRHDGLLGFSGLSVSSASAQELGWIEAVSEGIGSSFSLVDIFTLGQPGGGTLLVRADEAEPIAIPTRASMTQLQRSQLQLPEGRHRVVLSPKGDGEARILGISVERRGGGIIVDAIGVRGATAASWLDWDATLALRGLVTLAPDLVVLAYGTNEASHRSYTMEEYRSELWEVLRRLRRALPEAACILAGPSDRAVSLGEGRYAIWDRTEPVIAVQREMARVFGCAFWDWQQATGGPGSMVAWYYHQPQLAAGDLIHHTPTGYELVADRFIAALDQTLATTPP